MVGRGEEGGGRKRKELEGMIKWKIQSKRFIIPKGSDKNVTLGWLQIGNFGGGLKSWQSEPLVQAFFISFVGLCHPLQKKIQTAFVNNI